MTTDKTAEAAYLRSDLLKAVKAKPATAEVEVPEVAERDTRTAAERKRGLELARSALFSRSMGAR